MHRYSILTGKGGVSMVHATDGDKEVRAISSLGFPFF